MKRIFSIMTILAIVLAAASCEKDNDEGSKRPDTENNGSENGGSENEGTDGDGSGEAPDISESINTTFSYAYAENWGIYYEEQQDNINNWIIYLSENDFDEDGWSDNGYLAWIEIFSEGVDAPKPGKYTIDAFYESYFSDFSLLDGLVEDVDGEEMCTGTWLYQDGYGIAAALSGEAEVKVDGETYTVTYDLCDDEYGISFKGKYTGRMDIYDYSQGYSMSSVKSGAPVPERTKRPVSGLRIAK